MSSRPVSRYIPFWKEAPAVRFILPFMIGIVSQWYLQLPIWWLLALLAAGIMGLVIISRGFAKSTYKYGIGLFAVVTISGAMLVCVKNPYAKMDKEDTRLKNAMAYIATLEEPLVTKERTFKAVVTLEAVLPDSTVVNCLGKAIIYFTKDPVSATLQYGDQFLFKEALNKIEDTGNPGAFDYRRYAAFNDIYYRVNLKADKYSKLSSTHKRSLYTIIYTTRNFVLHQFRKYIPGKKETGLAEALLIGFKDDLDKNLVEDYANTGVVHIIAISGMHLGLIYGLLLALFKPLSKRRHGKLISGILIIAALWLFSLLTGAAPSITRSALMFTAIIIGNISNRQISMYNSLAVSAFALLIINPFNLWDVGFQLSYAAVFSIVLLGKPVTAWFTFSNKILQTAWQLIAVTIAAQVFTLPFVIYHFHQFPLLFILSNMIAVPLSSIILYGLIALLFISPITIIAKYAGLLIGLCIKALNNYISFIAAVSFSRVENIYINMLQAALLMLVIACICYWLLQKQAKALLTALVVSLILMISLNITYFISVRQHKIIVYNVPNNTAIDIINGRQFYFIGDSMLMQKSFLQNFHLLPSRIMHHVTNAQNFSVTQTPFTMLHTGETSIAIVNAKPQLQDSFHIKADFLLIGKNCRVAPAKLLRMFSCSTVITDAMLPQRFQSQWQIAADSLHLRLHSIKQGAFQYNL